MGNSYHEEDRDILEIIGIVRQNEGIEVKIRASHGERTVVAVFSPQIGTNYCYVPVALDYIRDMVSPVSTTQDDADTLLDRVREYLYGEESEYSDKAFRLREDLDRYLEARSAGD